QRLAHFDVPVDQVTYLDPHDFDQNLLGIDTAQQLSQLGQPAGYGATVWQNVNFTDVYYQTRGQGAPLVPNSLVPLGRPIPGAYNQLINAQLPAGYPLLSLESDHSYVWDKFYLNTVNNPASHTGYAFSRVKDPTLLT